MSNQWLRLWHDMPNDPKWRTIARIAKQPICVVLSVYVHILVNASNATERGRTQSLNVEDIASALDVEESAIVEIMAAMQGRVLDEDRVSGWEKRQPGREDGSAERARAWRESRKNADSDNANATERTPNAEKRPDTDTDTERALSISNEIDGENDVFPPAVVGRKKREKQDCPIQDIVSIYREVLPGHPDVFKLSAKRKSRIQARWRDDLSSLDDWRAYFLRVRESKFLTGRIEPLNGHRKPFVADLDWLVSEENMIKVVEGKYFA